MRKLLTVLTGAALVVGLAAPVWADSKTHPTDQPITAMADRGHGHGDRDGGHRYDSRCDCSHRDTRCDRYGGGSYRRYDPGCDCYYRSYGGSYRPYAATDAPQASPAPAAEPAPVAESPSPQPQSTIVAYHE